MVARYPFDVPSEPRHPQATDDDKRSRSQSALSGVLDCLLEHTEGDETVTLDDVFKAFSGRLYGPLLLLPSIALVTPLGAIPGMPIAIAVLLVLVAGQRVLGRETPWIPKRLRKKPIERDKLKNAFSKLRPLTKAIDAVVGPRLTVLVAGPMEQVLAMAIVAVGLSVPVFGLVPMAAIIPGAAAVLLSLAITARDGVLVLLSIAIIGGGAYAMNGWF